MAYPLMEYRPQEVTIEELEALMRQKRVLAEINGVCVLPVLKKPDEKQLGPIDLEAEGMHRWFS